jgi:hypothetical protein
MKGLQRVEGLCSTHFVWQGKQQQRTGQGRTVLVLVLVLVFALVVKEGRKETEESCRHVKGSRKDHF